MTTVAELLEDLFSRVAIFQPGFPRRQIERCFTDSMTGMFCCKNFCRQYDVFLETFTFQQDSAPWQHAQDTIELLRCSTPHFIAPDMWPPNSPDLNPVDYVIWSIM